MLSLDEQIAAIVATHRGAQNPVRIEEIARALWPEEWYQHGGRQRCERAVKAAVARLVNGNRMTIVASRGKNPGYFVPVSKHELDHAARTSVRQAVKMLRRAERLTGNARYGEMAGQLSLPF